MTKNSLRIAVGFTILIWQVVIVLTLIVLKWYDLLRDKELTAAVAIIVPLFAAYASTFVRYVLAHSTSQASKGARVNLPYTILALGIPTTFGLALMGASLVVAFYRARLDFETYKWMLGITQTVLGVYLGPIVSSLYGKVEDP